jgi:hypothetical protein
MPALNKSDQTSIDSNYKVSQWVMDVESPAVCCYVPPIGLLVTIQMIPPGANLKMVPGNEVT